MTEFELSVMREIRALSKEVSELAGLVGRVDERQQLTAKKHSERMIRIEDAIKSGDTKLGSDDATLAQRVSIIEAANAARREVEAENRGKIRGLLIALSAMQVLLVGVWKLVEWAGPKIMAVLS